MYIETYIETYIEIYRDTETSRQVTCIYIIIVKVCLHYPYIYTYMYMQSRDEVYSTAEYIHTLAGSLSSFLIFTFLPGVTSYRGTLIPPMAWCLEASWRSITTKLCISVCERRNQIREGMSTHAPFILEQITLYTLYTTYCITSTCSMRII